jgi:uncharacterized membrane protein
LAFVIVSSLAIELMAGPTVAHIVGIGVGIVGGVVIGSKIGYGYWLPYVQDLGAGIVSQTFRVQALGAIMGTINLDREQSASRLPFWFLDSSRGRQVFVPRFGLLSVAVFVALPALLVGFVVGLVFGAVGLVQGVAVGLLFALLTALLASWVIPWPRYQMVRAWLALKGDIPWRLLAFVKDAHRRGVLRQVGSVYQFRHARLQDRLAERSRHVQR